MSTPGSGEQSFEQTLEGLHIGGPQDEVHIVEPEPDPWKDVPTEASSAKSDVHAACQLHTPDPASLDPSVTQGLASEPDESAVRKHDQILLEFDPLVSAEDQAAREAWADSEGASASRVGSGTDSTQAPAPAEPNPAIAGAPPIVAPSPQFPPTPNQPSSPAPSFPALVALARTFSIPLGSRSQRPRSLDMAASVPSPTTLSQFAQQQSAPPTRPTHDDETSAAALGSASGRSTPGTRDPERERGRAEDSPPFDFQKFLDQMKTRSAEPVAKYLRSFLSNFAKRTFTVADQVKLINDFLNFISVRMREADVWHNATDAEFDNAMEGMEKLVMNRLYEFTFTPQVARMTPPRPVTVDDLERDRVLSQRIRLFQWIEPKHLDVPEGEGSEGFLMFAQQEVLKINHYKAPRDKLICILNCCKVIFGLIRHLHKEEGADTFIPILIYVVLKANPPHLLSNVEFINRFRNPAKLQSEAGYYLSSLIGAVSFIETMDHTSLSNIAKEEFEKNVEVVIQTLPGSEAGTPESATPPIMSPPGTPKSIPSSHSGEESAQPLTLPTPAQVLGEDARRFLQKTGDTFSKPLNAISRILNEVLDNAEESLSAIPSPFSPTEQQQQQSRPEEDDRQLARTFGFSVPRTPPGSKDDLQHTGNSQSLQTPYQPRVRRVPSPLASAGSTNSFRYGSPTAEDTPTRQRAPASAPYTSQSLTMGPSHSAAVIHSRPGSQDLRPQSAHVSRTPTPSLDLAGLQDEIDRAHERAAVAARETLKQIFPAMDPEIMDWVLEANEGDLGKSIEALLEMSSST